MNDDPVDRRLEVTVEKTPFVAMEARLPPSSQTQVALHLTGRCELEWAPGGRPWIGNPMRGAVTVVPAGRSGVLAVRGGPCEVLKLGLCDRLLRDWSAREERAWRGNPLIDCFARPDPLVQHLALALLRETERAETVDSLYRDALSNALLAHLLRRYSEHEPHEDQARVHPLSTHRTKRAIDLMEADLAHAIGLDEIAHELGISPSHFAAQFKARLGRSPGRYLTWLRLERARAMLEAGRLGIAEVAAAVGYASASHFASAFRREFGEPPGAWRARRR